MDDTFRPSGNDRCGARPHDGAKRLTPLETRFVELMAGGSSMDEAAKALGKSERQLRRWKLRPVVAEAIRARTAESMALARATLASAANRAARQLEELATKAKPDAARIAACKAVLENAKLGELDDLRGEVAELRSMVEAANRTGSAKGLS